MITELIIALGVTIATTSNPYVDCGGMSAIGCYYTQTKTIIVADTPAGEDILLHELGHALLYKDAKALALAGSQGYYYNELTTTYILNGQDPREETTANLFRDYVRDRNKLSLFRPCFTLYLDYKINQLLK